MRRTLLVWLLLMAVETLHGTLRTLFLAPVLGDAPARRVSVATGSVLVFVLTLATIRWVGATRATSLVGIGLLWVLLTVGFEVALGRLVFDMAWSRIAAEYDLLHGGYMGLGLLVMLLAPWATARLRGLKDASG